MDAGVVARYILDKMGRISERRLHVLLYYCQAWCLTVAGAPLFDNPIGVRECGPVVLDISRTRVDGLKDDDSFERSCIPLESQCLIDEVLAAYGKLSSDELDCLVRSEVPWLESFGEGVVRDGSSISWESMISYYSRLAALGSDELGEHIVPAFLCPPMTYVSEDDYMQLARD